ncbi:MAG: hypothetical protein V1746_07495 [bacterium]
MPTILHGQVLEPRTPKELFDALQAAFDYRGDVTITFQDDKTVEGFLYKVDSKANKISMFVPAENRESVSRTFVASTIRSLAFTGEDAAFGKSWEEMAKHQTS